MHQKFMKRCFELASQGLGKVAPNPLVGAVIVHDGKIIGEGYHTAFGHPHAEVEAIRSVKDSGLLSSSTLYVNLEPCNHQGKTPPCTDLILEHKIPQVTLSNKDPHELVAGKGIEKLQKNGVKVETGILEDEGAFLNRRFFLFHQKKRPYIILKWAQTQDGFMDKERKDSQPQIHTISSDFSHQLSHQWRTQEMGILAGRKTIENDDPLLTARLFSGKNPIRIVLDKNLVLSMKAKVFNEDAPTIILNSLKNEIKNNLEYLKIEGEFDLKNCLSALHAKNIQSIIIEGGKTVLDSFIQADLWDEARVFTAPIRFENGLPAPAFSFQPSQELMIGRDQLKMYYNL